MLFGENLNRICKEKGTNPTALCKELGLSTSKVGAWNKGSIPKAEIMLMLSKKLNCSVMDFFADEEDLVLREEPKNKVENKVEKKVEQKVEKKVENKVEDEDEQDILKVYRSLSRRAKHEFMIMVYEFENREELEGDNKNLAVR